MFITQFVRGVRVGMICECGRGLLCLCAGERGHAKDVLITCCWGSTACAALRSCAGRGSNGWAEGAWRCACFEFHRKGCLRADAGRASEDSRFRIQGLELRSEDSRFRVQGLELRSQGSG